MTFTTNNQTYNEKTHYCEEKTDYCGEEQDVISQLLELIVEKQEENYNLTQKLNKIQSILQFNTDSSQSNTKTSQSIKDTLEVYYKTKLVNG